MSKSLEHARLLLEKADEDLFALEQIGAGARCPQAIVGFHAQQAVEKSLKAVLTSRGISYPWTHDLGLLLDLLADHHMPWPSDAASLPALTPFAAEFRYGRLPHEGGEPPLDVDAVLACAKRTRQWARDLLSA